MHQGNTTFNTEEIEIHIRTYRSLLKSTGEVAINQLITSHNSMKSILHEKGSKDEVDMSAFIYVLLRLPFCMSNVKKVILGQSYDVFANHGFGQITGWKMVAAPGRRRMMYFDGRDTLAVYIASVTDVDDLITLLTAFQIEWNKFHQKLKNTGGNIESAAGKILEEEDIEKVKNIWGGDYIKFLTAIKYKEVDFTVRLLAGSYVEYAKSTQKWWNNISENNKDLRLDKRPVYFISSNTHSIINLLTRFVVGEEKGLIDFLYKTKDENLISLWRDIESDRSKVNRENFLYYIAKKYARINPPLVRKKAAMEKKIGIRHIAASHYLDIDAQVVEFRNLSKLQLSPQIGINTKSLAKSDAVAVNIDYPLGWAAYQVLTEIGQNVSNVRGVYIMGKAATLNGQIGDILLPTTVFDQHTKNIYVFNNSFSGRDFKNIFKTGLVLDHQKTIAAKGTFLENRELIKKWYREGYTAIEMESGPYLNAMYEFVYYNRYAENQFINLTDTPFDIGIAHYASDTPYSKAKNLGVRNLSYEGVEPTYAISLAILKKIIEKETG
ncbi:hypothetical protein M1271_00880 [Patescibacteria group bacterium]|nr:hypothetical protein [Patescibacteria group bacterium]